jgi:hypothetical protein
MMIRQKQAGRGGLAAIAFAVALALVGGCSSPASTSSDQEATVHGTVVVKGKRAALGKVLFNPANINRKAAPTASADIAKDGTYTIKTLVGRNKVSISTHETVHDPVLQYNSSYFEVKPGDNTYEIEVSSSP